MLGVIYKKRKKRAGNASHRTTDTAVVCESARVTDPSRRGLQTALAWIAREYRSRVGREHPVGCPELSGTGIRGETEAVVGVRVANGSRVL